MTNCYLIYKNVNFFHESYQKMKEKSLQNLTDTAKDFFYLLSEFGKLKKKKKKKKRNKNSSVKRPNSRTHNRHVRNISAIFL